MSNQNIESLDQQLQNATVDANPATLRERNIDAMYKDFVTNAEHDTYMKHSDFEKFAVLYLKSTRDRLASTEATREEREHIAELSEEFYHSVNTQRPIHIVDDYSGEEIFVLPPLFRRLNTLTTAEQAEATQILASTFEESDISNPSAYVRKQIATDNLYRNILRVQDNDQLKADQNQYAKLAKSFSNNYWYNGPKEEVNDQKQENVQEKKAAASEVDDEDVLVFEE